MIRPVSLGVEPGEVQGKSRVGPASCQPCTVVYQAHGSQDLDQRQFAHPEIMKFIVSFDQLEQLRLPVVSVARKQHPQILYGRPHHRVIKINKVRCALMPQNVPEMTVTMDPQ